MVHILQLIRMSMGVRALIGAVAKKIRQKFRVRISKIYLIGDFNNLATTA